MEVRVGVGADHRASVRVELEVCTAAAADLQQTQCPVGICKCANVSEELSLNPVYFGVV